jgi:hypothetical protein
VVRDLRAEIEAGAADCRRQPRAGRRVPQLLLPPSFRLGPARGAAQAFTPSDLADRLAVYNLRNIGLTRAQVTPPERDDRVLELGGGARVPEWVSRRYEQRLRRDLGLDVPERGAGDEPSGRRPL